MSLHGGRNGLDGLFGLMLDGLGGLFGHAVGVAALGQHHDAQRAGGHAGAHGQKKAAYLHMRPPDRQRTVVPAVLPVMC